MTDQEAQIRKLKHALEHWKEIVLLGKKVFIWDKQWHPTALVGGSTILFTFLWLLDPSILTVVSVFGLVLTVCDYMIPTIASSFFKPEKWTSRKEQEFEELCTSIVLYKAKIELAWGRYYRMKNTNRKMYFGLTIVFLSLLAYIGCSFNNLFIAYVLVTLLMLFPGMEHKGMIRRCSEQIHNFVTELLRQGKSKLPEKKD
ncbi:hypothetical protein Zmor_025644 [Zophobas morio]|uniref:RETREG1-3/ARL6IP-like N-terminal reticulon-homology domain-containing protein n=1 Tax=Zophobas morio TaxID=2755281 RepID=A0AA38HTM4_9CUCU|nr:hypothetical protein Zmor_025644 [Zophobas morio]